MVESIKSLDERLFLLINGLHIDWMDPIMYQMSNKLFWLPLYLFLLYLIQRRYGWKNFAWFTLLVALTILFCDQISSTFLKQYFARYRPCNNLEIGPLVHKVYDRCGGGFSFVSGHATNYFGLSLLTALFLKNRWASILLLFWAALIAYSRVYLGVHYPADVSCGALLGLTIGGSIYLLNTWAVQKSGGKYGVDENFRK